MDAAENTLGLRIQKGEGEKLSEEEKDTYELTGNSDM